MLTMVLYLEISDIASDSKAFFQNSDLSLEFFADRDFSVVSPFFEIKFI